MACAAAAGLAAAVFLLYFAVYRVRGYDVPLGFDAPWYVWRAEFVAERGIGPLGTDVRPGHALLSAVLGSMTGLSQLELAVLLPLVLVALFALAVAAFCWTGLGHSWFRWGVVAGVAATLLGATRLVGENVANLLLLVLVVAALVPLADRVGGERGFAGAVLLLLAAGLAHWVFLAVAGAALLLAAALAVPEGLADRRAGVALARTEAGIVAGVVGVAGVAMAGLIAGVLRAPFETFEIREDPARFAPKLRTDLRRAAAWATAPLAAVGGAALWWGRTRPDRSAPPDAQRPARRYRFALRLLLAWAAVCLGGMAYGVATRDLPPHRFLAMLVALPGVVGAATAIVVAAGWVGRRIGGRFGRRFGRVATLAVAGAGVVAIAVPGAVAWYGRGPGVWIGTDTLRQARTAGRLLEGLPEGRTVVFLVGPFGRAGVLSVPLKERVIRVGVPPDRQEDVHLFVGELEDLVAERRTVFEGPKTNLAVEPYWLDVRPILAGDPAVFVLRSLATRAYEEILATGVGEEAAPGVLVLGDERIPAVDLEPLTAIVPTIEAGLLWAALLLLVLGVAGAGWSVALLAPRTPPAISVPLMPAFGIAGLALGALIVERLGFRLAGVGSVVLWVAVTVTGVGMALRAARLAA